ncbi:sulfotransferase [Sphingomonas sp. JC676]|uniref:tetratricopeptide repeat-containing sulfotransferase family protein n=1 Tax=Sphingomonas sp. JC676 TaxID=2768065 RepID=UPI0016581C07|nr:sulfotransferase [Sphingomonas sp. JC676]MBC9032044.1 sulfotransferase [Sphingomonas sp. JC676]
MRNAHSQPHPSLQEAARALREGRRGRADAILIPFLRQNPHDANALALIAESAMLAGAYLQSEGFARRALAANPGHQAARWTLARALVLQKRPEDAIAAVEPLIAGAPHAGPAMLKAGALDSLGDYEGALAIYRHQLDRRPDNPALWASYGHVLRTVRRIAEAIAAYRKAIELDADTGEPWWLLAALKALWDEDVPKMEAVLSRPLPADAASYVHFALGRVLDEAGRHEQAFDHYAAGNRLRLPPEFDPAAIEGKIEQIRTLLTPAFLAERPGRGDPAPDPIFIVGLPRSGSTLIEQILDSHSMVEGTSELPHLPALVRDLLEQRENRPGAAYPDLLAGLPADRFAALGKAYLDRARPHRKTAKPYFIDKLPHNWEHIGLIHLALPHARIIDVRRDAMDCCFANFRHCFGKGHPASYSLEAIGHYYRGYVDLTAHFDAVLPGRIYRLEHEALIADPERETRALLEALDLPFEEACLAPHENARAVRTASSEQVTRPINSDGIGAWRPYAAWLDPLRRTLGDLAQ